MQGDRLTYRFDPGAGGCLWPGDADTAARLGPGPVDAGIYGLDGTLLTPPAVPLPPALAALRDRLDAEFATHLNPVYPPAPSLWRQSRCARFTDEADRLLALLRAEPGARRAIHDGRTALTEDPGLDAWLAANPGHRAVD